MRLVRPRDDWVPRRTIAEVDYFALLSGPVAGDWRHFLNAWVGETDAGWGLPEDPADWTLSRSLKDFYRTVARWDDLQVHLRLIPTAELSPGPDGRTVFLVEEQGVYEWAVTSDADTDLVWGRYPGGGEWQPERELLPRFLTQVVFHLGVMHPPHGAVANRIPIAGVHSRR